MANMSEENKEPLTLEESLEQLDAVMRQLENPDNSLEESFRLYEQGMKLVQSAGESIDKVEKMVLKLREDGSVTPLE